MRTFIKKILREEIDDFEWAMDDVEHTPEDILNVALEYEQYGDEYKASVSKDGTVRTWGNNMEKISYIILYQYNDYHGEYDPIFYFEIPQHMEKVLNSDESFERKLEILLDGVLDITRGEVELYKRQVSHLGPNTVGQKDLRRKEELHNKLEDIYGGLGFTKYYGL